MSNQWPLTVQGLAWSCLDLHSSRGRRWALTWACTWACRPLHLTALREGWQHENEGSTCQSNHGRPSLTAASYTAVSESKRNKDTNHADTTNKPHWTTDQSVHELASLKPMRKLIEINSKTINQRDLSSGMWRFIYIRYIFVFERNDIFHFNLFN